MSARSRPSPQLTLLDPANAISSPASPDGPSHSGSPASATPQTSGQDRVHASRSRKRVSARASTTSGTSGQPGSRSSASADLQSSLESRLRDLTAGCGSTLYRLTWKALVTPSGRPVCQLQASALRTGESVCSSWPTPTCEDSQHGSGQPGKRNLVGAALASWPTPKASDAERGGHPHRHYGDRRNLVDTAQLAPWSTPAAHDAGGTPAAQLARKAEAKARGLQLGQSVTNLSLQAQLAEPGQTPSGSDAPTKSGGQLNPVFVLWLMGFTDAWARCMPVVTR